MHNCSTKNLYIRVITRYPCARPTHSPRHSLSESLALEYTTLFVNSACTESWTIGSHTITIRNAIQYSRCSLRKPIVISVYTVHSIRIYNTYHLSCLHRVIHNSSTTQRYIHAATRYSVARYYQISSSFMFEPHAHPNYTTYIIYPVALHHAQSLHESSIYPYHCTISLFSLIRSNLVNHVWTSRIYRLHYTFCLSRLHSIIYTWSTNHHSIRVATRYPVIRFVDNILFTILGCTQHTPHAPSWHCLFLLQHISKDTTYPYAYHSSTTRAIHSHIMYNY